MARKKCIIGAKETHFPILLSVFFAVIILKHLGEPNKHEAETNKKVLTLKVSKYQNDLQLAVYEDERHQDENLSNYREDYIL